MPDADIPKTLDEFANRSYKAIKHMFPEAAVSRAMTAERTHDGERYVIEGTSWSVEWAKDAHVAWMQGVIVQYRDGKMDSETFINEMFKTQLTKKVEL